MAYRGLIEKIERLSGIVAIVVIISFFSVTVPFLLYSLVSYYIFDSGRESFILTLLVKFVLEPSEKKVFWGNININ